MLDDFLVRAAIAGIGVALAAGPLGCFMVWRRMAYFGDATAHAAVLGIALSLAFSVSIFAGVLLTSLAMALIVSSLTERDYGVDTLLGVLSHSALALGLVAVSFLPNVRVDLMRYLFGDILAISKGDLAIIWIGAASVCAIIFSRWSRLLTSTLSQELAYASGIKPAREQLVLTLCLAITVAVAIKVVGALLIGSLLIIPAATARGFSSSPERMAISAMVLGCLSVLLGLGASLRWDTPAGPTIVSLAAALFALSNVVQLLRRA